MNMQKRHLARKTTALLSAIAASGLLGLPALAGNPASVTNAGTNQAQAPSNVDPQCVPSNQANQPSTTAAPDASAPAAAQLPNQSDPRTGTAPSNQTVSPADQAAGNTTSVPSTNASAVQSRDAADTSRQATSYGQDNTYGDVLSQGGATAGGFASQQVLAANNPDAYRSVSSRISSNEQRPNYSSGAGMTGMGSTTSSTDSTRSTTGTQPYSQSSRATASTTIALCPNGTTPQSTAPSTRQAPSQPNLNAQPSSSEQASPQQTTGNETRPSSADDNSGRTR